MLCFPLQNLKQDIWSLPAELLYYKGNSKISLKQSLLATFDGKNSSHKRELSEWPLYYYSFEIPVQMIFM